MTKQNNTSVDYNAKLESLRMEMLVKRILRMVIAFGLILVVLEFVTSRHGKIAMEDIPLFLPVFALLMTAVIVCIGRITRFLLSRPAEYYMTSAMNEAECNGDSDD